ncbi:MAG TPA: glycosyltransferase family 39 protein [Chloroflexia bacterium]|nr:glycosyltransferase family 39 protein [Chloroflexia bacterium]
MGDGSLFAPITGDELQFHELAENLASGHGFTIAGSAVINRMPGYPVLLAGLYLVTGPSLVAARLLNTVLGALCVPLVYQLGKQLWGQRVGLGAGTIFALDPFSMFWPQFLLSENLQILLVTLLGVLLTGAQSSILRAQLAGIVAALSILTHPGTLLVVAAALVWYWFYGRGRRFPVRHFVFLALSLLVLMSFWTVRNWTLTGRFVPLTAGVEASGGGFVFWISNNAVTAQPGQYWGRYVPFREYSRLPDFPEYSSLPSNDPALLDRKGYEYGLKFVTTQPGQVPMLLLGKLLNFWEPEVMTRSGYHVVPLLGVIVLPLYLIGLIRHWRKSLQTRLAVACIAAALTIALIFWGGARFRAPTEAFFVLCLTIGLVQIWSWVRQFRPTNQTSSS